MVVCPACNGDSQVKGIQCFLCESAGMVDKETAQVFLDGLIEQKKKGKRP